MPFCWCGLDVRAIGRGHCNSHPDLPIIFIVRTLCLLRRSFRYLLIFFLGGGADQDELASPAHFTVLEITSRNQGSELSSATMIPQWL